MAIRKCPQCLAVVSPGAAAALTDAIECPGCGTPLEVAPVTRFIAAWAGLAAGFVTWVSLRGKEGLLGWGLVVLFPILAFGVVAALITMFTADLRKREVIALEAVPDDAHGAGHSSHGHGGHS